MPATNAGAQRIYVSVKGRPKRKPFILSGSWDTLCDEIVQKFQLRHRDQIHRMINQDNVEIEKVDFDTVIAGDELSVILQSRNHPRQSQSRWPIASKLRATEPTEQSNIDTACTWRRH
jgi:hypothetical protein